MYATLPVSKQNATPRRTIVGVLVLAGAAAAVSFSPAEAEAGYFYRHRQYYSSWNYRPKTSYHYCRYYYSPAASNYSYNYHYVIYYPSRPRYRYYYNPVRRVYWGRYEVNEAGEPVGYSKLKKEDQKTSLADIPESAFPKATKMPVIPESKDQTAMLEPPAAPDKDSPSGKPGAYEKKFPEGPSEDQPET